MFLTLPGLLVPLNIVISRSRSLSSLLAASVEAHKRGIFCILLTQCCNAAMFCNELQCHNSFWSGKTVTFLKACELSPCSQSECASTCWHPKYDQVAGLYSELHSLQASSLEEGLYNDWIMHSVGLPSKLFIYLHSLLACDMAGRGFIGSCWELLP